MSFQNWECCLGEWLPHLDFNSSASIRNLVPHFQLLSGYFTQLSKATPNWRGLKIAFTSFMLFASPQNHHVLNHSSERTGLHFPHLSLVILLPNRGTHHRDVRGQVVRPCTATPFCHSAPNSTPGSCASCLGHCDNIQAHSHHLP
jgi:hypothetical protein